MSAAQPSPRELAQACERDVRELMHSFDQWVFPRAEQRRFSTEVFWEVTFRSPVEIGDQLGDWNLHGTWRYWAIPGTEAGALRESSVGLTVTGSPLHGLPDEFCVARYDVECYGEHLGMSS